MKIDLHIHTNFSDDGLSSPREVVDSAIEKGLDAICITDHDEIKGALEALKYAFDKNILVIPGIEITTRYDHVLAINIKKIIPRSLSFYQTLKEIRKQKALAVVPHPFCWPVGEFFGTEKDLLMADAIEVFNAHIISFSNKKALKLSQKYNLPFTAGSDAHKAKFVGRGYLEIPKENLSEEKILEEIRQRTGIVRGKSLSIMENIENGKGTKFLPYLRDYFRLKSTSRKFKN